MIGVSRLDATEHARAGHGVEGGEAVVADDYVSAIVGTGIDVVLALATEHDIRTVADHDLVVAAGGRRGRTDVDQSLVLTERSFTVVADHEVASRVSASVDQVGATAAKHDIRTVRGEDGVVAAVLGVGGGDAQQRAAAVHVVEDGFAVVADDHVGAGVCANTVASLAIHVDVVDADSAEHDVVAVADQDIVVAASPGHGGPDLGQHTFAVEDGLAVVADHDVAVVAHASVDHVRAAAGQDHVRAVDGRNDVAVAVLGVGGGSLPQHVLAIHRVEPRVAIVTHDDAIAGRGGDGVAPGATENNVVAVAHLDHVIAAGRGLAGGDLLGSLLDAIGLTVGHVRVRLLDVVRAKHRALEVSEAKPRDQLAGLVAVVHGSLVSDDDVASLAAFDRVVTFAAEDDQRQCGVGGVDDVIAGLRVHREGAVDLSVERDVHGIVAFTGIEDGHRSEAVLAAHGAVDRDLIVAGPHEDFEDFQVAIGDVADHAEAGDLRLGQGARLVLHAVVVDHVERVHLLSFIREEVRAGVGDGVRAAGVGEVVRIPGGVEREYGVLADHLEGLDQPELTGARAFADLDAAAVKVRILGHVSGQDRECLSSDTLDIAVGSHYVRLVREAEGIAAEDRQ